MAMKELIKPSSPTPSHLRTLQLSLLDQLIPAIYVVGIFFYKAEPHAISKETVSLRLKKSLSEILTRFYPLAGRLEGPSIDCNDEGAVFMEAKTDCLLSEFLRNPLHESLELLVPSDSIISGEPVEITNKPLLNVMVTHFRSGGFAVSVSASHKLCDASSFSTFVNKWAETARGCGDAVSPPPEFAETTIYPPADPSDEIPDPSTAGFDAPREPIITKRFVFDAFKIRELKCRASGESVKNPTRVEAVTAVIWKCATKASRSNSSTPRPSPMKVFVDLRRRSHSSMPSRNSIGNLITTFTATQGPESEMGIGELVTQIRKKKEELSKEISENLQGDGIGAKMKNLIPKLLKAEERPYTTTAWCGMPFYEADFGWGRPVWFAPAWQLHIKLADYANLVDAIDGEGIEAWVTLTEQDMVVFEHDPELLAVAAPNPGVLI